MLVLGGILNILMNTAATGTWPKWRHVSERSICPLYSLESALSHWPRAPCRGHQCVTPNEKCCILLAWSSVFINGDPPPPLPDCLWNLKGKKSISVDDSRAPHLSILIAWIHSVREDLHTKTNRNWVLFNDISLWNSKLNVATHISGPGRTQLLKWQKSSHVLEQNEIPPALRKRRRNTKDIYQIYFHRK